MLVTLKLCKFEVALTNKKKQKQKLGLHQTKLFPVLFTSREILLSIKKNHMYVQ